MARSSDSKKVALWLARFRRFLDSGPAVARFCAVEGVSQSSFYYWQKKLGPQATRSAASVKGCGDSVNNSNIRVEDRGARAESRGARVESRGACVESRSACVESRSVRADGRSVFQTLAVVPATCGVLVRLPGGTQIEVGTEHLDAIRAVVAETVRVDHGRAAGRDVSSDNQVTRKASSHNQVIRQRSGIVSC